MQRKRGTMNKKINHHKTIITSNRQHNHRKNYPNYRHLSQQKSRNE